MRTSVKILSRISVKILSRISVGGISMVSGVVSRLARDFCTLSVSEKSQPEISRPRDVVFDGRDVASIASGWIF
jgi:hypothetical protein